MNIMKVHNAYSRYNCIILTENNVISTSDNSVVFDEYSNLFNNEFDITLVKTVYIIYFYYLICIHIKYGAPLNIAWSYLQFS